MRKRIILLGLTLSMVFVSVQGNARLKDMVDFFSNKSEKNVLATYTGGRVTRGQFYDWLEERRLKKDKVLQKKSDQRKKLKKITLEQVTILEAKKAGFDKSDDFKFVNKLVKRYFMGRYFKKHLRKNVSFKEEVVKTRIIKLLVRDYKVEKNKRVKLSEQEQEKHVREKMASALSIISELNRGADFAELAKTHSDDYSKHRGGAIGYISHGMRGEEFSRAVFKLQKREFTQKPVEIRNAIYIIKAEDRAWVTPETIEKVVGDKRDADRLEKRLSIMNSRGMEKKMETGPGKETFFENVSNPDPSTVLFKVGDTSYTVAEFNRLIEYLEGVRSQGRVGRRKTVLFDDNKKKKLVQRVFKEEVFMQEALRKKMDQKEDFKKEWKFFSERNMAYVYKNEVVLSGIVVTEKEIEKFYKEVKKEEQELGKDFGMEPGMPDEEIEQVSKKETYRKELERIELILRNKKIIKKKRAWEKAILVKYNFQVDESQLEGE
ncbi:MAG: hypothetical protein GY754_09605 [bacterium]|nr:hypothetical protein [bacterium]